MIPRIPIATLKDKAGESVSVAGSVHSRRDHGKLVFFDLRDASGMVQSVALPQNAEAHAVAGEIRPEWVVLIEGQVNKRPDKMVKPEQENGTVELEAKKITILGTAKDLPFELGAELNIDTYLNFLPLTLRDPKRKAVFAIQASIVRAFRAFLDRDGFTEIQVPKLIGDDAEGGANSFDVPYFGHTAHLAQSPQFYKQIMVGVFEKVYAVGNVYRAEKHATTRHLNEYTSLDVEMGFIEDMFDVMRMENRLLASIVADVAKDRAKEIALLGATLPSVPSEIPIYSMREVQEIIKKEYGEDCTKEPDLEPQHERWICEYAKKKHDSDFVFVTHYPLSKRAMYTFEDPKVPGYGGFDLLFRGVEITSGSQRIHDHDTLVARMEKKGLDPEKFSYYLQAFKFGMPPHGGIGIGLERLTSKFLGIENVKEAALFPRDINRIDTLLTKVKGREDE